MGPGEGKLHCKVFYTEMEQCLSSEAQKKEVEGPKQLRVVEGYGVVLLGLRI